MSDFKLDENGDLVALLSRDPDCDCIGCSAQRMVTKTINENNERIAARLEALTAKPYRLSEREWHDERRRAVREATDFSEHIVRSMMPYLSLQTCAIRIVRPAPCPASRPRGGVRPG